MWTFDSDTKRMVNRCVALGKSSVVAGDGGALRVARLASSRSPFYFAQH